MSHILHLKIIPSFKTMKEAFDFIKLLQKKTRDSKLFHILLVSPDLNRVIEKYDLVKQTCKETRFIENYNSFIKIIKDRKRIEQVLSRCEQVLQNVKEVNELVIIPHLYAKRKSRKNDKNNNEKETRIVSGFFLNDLYKPTFEIEHTIIDISDITWVYKDRYLFFKECCNDLKLDFDLLPATVETKQFIINTSKSNLNVKSKYIDSVGHSGIMIEYDDWKKPFEMLKLCFHKYMWDSLECSITIGGSSRTIRQVKEIFNIDDTAIWTFQGYWFNKSDFAFLRKILKGKDNVEITWEGVWDFKEFTPTGFDFKLTKDETGYSFRMSSEDNNFAEDDFKSAIENEINTKLELLDP